MSGPNQEATSLLPERRILLLLWTSWDSREDDFLQLLLLSDEDACWNIAHSLRSFVTGAVVALVSVTLLLLMFLVTSFWAGMALGQFFLLPDQ